MNIRIISFLAVCLLTCGCGGKQVGAYAKLLESVLKEYRDGLQARLDSERRLYQELAEVFAAEAERDVYESLKLERQHQAQALGSDLLFGAKNVPAITEGLRAVTEREFSRTREHFEAEMTLADKYTSGLGKLALNAKKIDALGAALSAVGQEPGLKAAVGDVMAFGTTFKTELDLQGCKEIERRIATKAESIAMHQAEETQDKTRIAALTSEKTALEKQLDSDAHFDKSSKKCK